MVGLGLVDDFYVGSSIEWVSVRRVVVVSVSGVSVWSVVEFVMLVMCGWMDGGMGFIVLEECWRGM